MLVVGLTGGIGSGKSSVAKILEDKLYPVYNSDDRAKYLMNHSSRIKRKLIEIFGEATFDGDVLNRKYLAGVVFNNSEKLALLNSVVHPEVARDFLNWKNQQKSDIVFKEAAILFESGAYKSCDLNVNIYADLNDRINRVIKRDAVTREDVLARINNQWTDEQRNSLSDFSLLNDDYSKLEEKIDDLLTFLKSKKETL